MRPYTNEQLDAALSACIAFANDFPNEPFASGNVAGRAGLGTDVVEARRVLEWIAAHDSSLLGDLGVGTDKIKYFCLGPAARTLIDSGGFSSYFSDGRKSADGRTPHPDDALFLSLSGGGLRATIFHLGALLYLSDSKRIANVRGMVAVSGGSILAAHVVNRWDDAIKSAEDFDRVAAELIIFMRTNIRDTVLIPWLWSRLIPINWWRSGQSRTARLRATYDKHFQGQTLGGLGGSTRPFLAMVATDSIKQERVAFTVKDILRFPIATQSQERADATSVVSGANASGVPVALAVAASSCFPPVFPRMLLTNHDLALNYGEFKDTFSLNDGGVTDNLGLEVLLELQATGHDLGDRIVVCNVERPLRSKPGDTVLADNSAQAAALSKAAEERILDESKTACSFVRILSRPDLPLALSFAAQTKLAVFRTDLDAPEWGEIQALLLHGFSCAASALDADNYASMPASRSRSRVAGILNKAGCGDTLGEPTVVDLERSYKRPLKRIALHASLVFAVVVALISSAYVAVATDAPPFPGGNAVPVPRLTPPTPTASLKEVTFLPALDYRPFEVQTYEMFVDLRLWKPYSVDAGRSKTSPVIVTRRMSGIKKEPVDVIRIYGSTEGIGIDAACISGQRYWVEHAQGTGNPSTVLMQNYHVVIDISSVAVGERFEVAVEMTMWNGLKEDDPWLAFVAFTDIPKFQVSVLFPEKRPYISRKFVKYPNQQDDEVPAENEFKQLEVPARNRIYWEIKPAIKQTTYELQWTW